MKGKRPNADDDREELAFMDDFELMLEDMGDDTAITATQMAIVESENFAIYSNIEFLYLIGKYAAKSKQCSEAGLKSLSDFLLLLDLTKDSQKDYHKRRALALYQIGIILSQSGDAEESAKYFQVCIEDLRANGLIKEADLAQQKVTK